MSSAQDFITQRLGFGCGRLKGGSDKAHSLRLIHTALDLGIRHFDTAPPYGLGASEPVLGEALKGRTETTTVYTKVGLPRPASPGLMQTARVIVKPLANRIPGLRKAVLKGMAQRATPANFDPAFVAQSFEASLRLLQRDRVDALLLHEATPGDHLAPLVDLFKGYMNRGLIGAYGSSTGESVDRLVRFGSVQQYRCPEPGTPSATPQPGDVLHGAFRFIAPAIDTAMARNAALQDELASLLPAGTDPHSATGALAMAYALARYPNRLLFSTNDPQRLATTLAQIRHIADSGAWHATMSRLTSALTQEDLACAP